MSLIQILLSVDKILCFMTGEWFFQFKERVLEIPVSRCADRWLCAIYLARATLSPGTYHDMTFRILTLGRGSAPFLYANYQETLKIFADKAGLDPSLFSSHSLRKGGGVYLPGIVWGINRRNKGPR